MKAKRSNHQTRPLTHRLAMWGGAFVLMLLALAASAENRVFQSPEEFVRMTFIDAAPEQKVLWITGDLRERAIEILGHKIKLLRVRYWAGQNRTAWILDEVGKVEPITTGIVVEDGQIKEVKILVYRESRGWEVRFPFFTDQFRGAAIEGSDRLTLAIDGISGATLSVRAITKQARLALLFDRKLSNGL